MGEDEGYIPYEPDYPPPVEDVPPPSSSQPEPYEEPPPPPPTDFSRPSYSTRTEAEASKVKFKLVKEGEEKKKIRRKKVKTR